MEKWLRLSIHFKGLTQLESFFWWNIDMPRKICDKKVWYSGRMVNLSFIWGVILSILEDSLRMIFILMLKNI